MNWSETPVRFGDLVSFLMFWEGMKLILSAVLGILTEPRKEGK